MFSPPVKRNFYCNTASIENRSHDITETAAGSNRCCLSRQPPKKTPASTPLSAPTHTGAGVSVTGCSEQKQYLHQLHPVRPRNSPFSEFHKNVLHPPSLSLFLDILAPCDISPLLTLSGLTARSVDCARPENEKGQFWSRLLQLYRTQFTSRRKPAPPANWQRCQLLNKQSRHWLSKSRSKSQKKWRHRPICIVISFARYWNGERNKVMGEVIHEQQKGGGGLKYALNCLFCFCYRKWWASSVNCILFSLSHPVFRISKCCWLVEVNL